MRNNITREKNYVFAVVCLVILLIISVSFIYLFKNDKKEEAPSDQLPNEITQYIEEHPTIQDLYIRDTYVVSKTKQKVKDAKVHTYYVAHAVYPDLTTKVKVHKEDILPPSDINSLAFHGEEHDENLEYITRVYVLTDFGDKKIVTVY